MKFIFCFFFALLVGNFAIPLFAAEKVAPIDPKQRIISSLKTPSNLLFEDEFMQLYYKASSVSPSAMMKMSFSDGPMYYFGKLVVVNKTDAELEVKVDVLDKISKNETIDKVDALEQRRMAYNDNYVANSGPLPSLVAGAVSGKLRNNFLVIKNQINKDFISDTEVTQLKLSAHEANVIEFGLKNFKQKPQIVLSYKPTNSEIKFFFQGVADEEFQKQVLTDSEKYSNVAFLDGKISNLATGLYVFESPNPVQVLADFSADKAVQIKESKAADEKTKSLPGITSPNKFKAENVNLLVLQNYKNQPSSPELVLWKLIPNEKTQERKVSHKIPLKTTEITKGMLKIATYANKGLLAPGEYALSEKGKEVYYEFSIEQ
jgi:hypothetical protein